GVTNSSMFWGLALPVGRAQMRRERHEERFITAARLYRGRRVDRRGTSTRLASGQGEVGEEDHGHADRLGLVAGRDGGPTDDDPGVREESPELQGGLGADQR